MKRSGFKRLTLQEFLAKEQARKAKKKTAKRTTSSKPKRAKYPTVLGIKASRYVGLKGVLWTIFSIYVRKRDFLKYHGRCVSCGTRLKHWRDGDAGHYVSVSRGNFLTLFDEQNVALQCKKCNNPTWTPDAAIPFGYELNRRYGEGTAEAIFKRSQTTGTSYSELEYMREIEHYKAKSDKMQV